MSNKAREYRMIHLKDMIREHNTVTAIELEKLASENTYSLLDTATCYNAIVYASEKANNKTADREDILKIVKTGMQAATISQLEVVGFIFRLVESLFDVHISEQEIIMIRNMTENKWGYV